MTQDSKQDCSKPFDIELPVDEVRETWNPENFPAELRGLAEYVFTASDEEVQEVGPFIPPW